MDSGSSNDSRDGVDVEQETGRDQIDLPDNGGKAGKSHEPNHSKDLDPVKLISGNVAKASIYDIVPTM